MSPDLDKYTKEELIDLIGHATCFECGLFLGNNPNLPIVSWNPFVEVWTTVCESCAIEIENK